MPAPDRLIRAHSGEPTRCLVVSEAGPLTMELVTQLVEVGWHVSVLELAGTATLALPQGVQSYASAISEQALCDTTDKIVRDAGSLDALIYLHPEPSESGHTAQDWLQHKSRLHAVFALAGRLKAQLASSSAQPRKTFMAVTRSDGAFALREAVLPPLAAALFGLTKSLAWEWPLTFCRAVDLKRELEPGAAAAQLLAELEDPQRGLVQVGWDGVRRRGLDASAVEVTYDGEDTGSDDIDPSHVFVVSGGARGVTADCVLELARCSRAGFVLLGRTVLDRALPSWAREADGAPELQRAAAEHLRASGDKPTPVKIAQLIDPIMAQHECRAFVDELRAVGSRAVYVSCDVTQPDAVRAAVATGVRALGPITGIIHGAGVLADKLVEKKTWLDFERVFATKVDGLSALLQCVEPTALRYLAVFSSVAGFFGNRGQTDYAMANEVLNAWASGFQRRHPQCRVVSYNWGPWDGGMVSPALRSLLKQQGVPLIDRAAGASTFVEALRSCASAALPHLIVGATVQPTRAEPPRLHRTHRLGRQLSLERTPLLVDHRIGDNIVLPMTHAASWLASSCEDVYPGHHFYRLENLRLYKGIVLSERLPEQFSVTLDELAGVDPDMRRVASVISAPHSSGHVRPYYSADVLVRRAPLPQRLDHPAVPTFCRFDLRADPSLRERNPYGDGTLFHGPAFQSIRQVLNITDTGITVRCSGQRVHDKDAGQFRVGVFDPYRFDACFQAILVWVRVQYNAAALPMGLDSGEMYCALPDAGTYFVTVSVTSQTPTATVCELYVHDHAGRLYGRLTGARAVVSQHLTRLFAPANRHSSASVGAERA